MATGLQGDVMVTRPPRFRALVSPLTLALRAAAQYSANTSDLFAMEDQIGALPSTSLPDLLASLPAVHLRTVNALLAGGARAGLAQLLEKLLPWAMAAGEPGRRQLSRCLAAAHSHADVAQCPSWREARQVLCRLLGPGRVVEELLAVVGAAAMARRLHILHAAAAMNASSPVTDAVV